MAPQSRPNASYGDGRQSLVAKAHSSGHQWDRVNVELLSGLPSSDVSIARLSDTPHVFMAEPL